MSQHDAEHWDNRYRSGGGPRGDNAARMLQQYAHHIDAWREQLTAAGEVPLALDVACGAGGALGWLAPRGWHVTGVDVSRAALALARARIEQLGLTSRCTLRQTDLDHWRPPPDSVHLVVQFFFLDRALLPALRDAIRVGGLLVLETMNHHRLLSRPQTTSAHLLAPGELQALATSWGWPIIEFHTSGPESRHPTDAIILRRPAISRYTVTDS